MTGGRIELRLEDYFAGHSKAWGIFQDRFGKLRRQFEVDIAGTWDDEKQRLTLVEDFRYDDGQTEQRTWRIAKRGAKSYEGRSDGVIGVAKGTVHGSAVNFRYRFALPVQGRIWVVRFDDWFFLQSDEVLINRASVTKFSVLLGQATIVFRRSPCPAIDRSGRLGRVSDVASASIEQGVVPH